MRSRPVRAFVQAAAALGWLAAGCDASAPPSPQQQPGIGPFGGFGAAGVAGFAGVPAAGTTGAIVVAGAGGTSAAGGTGGTIAGAGGVAGAAGTAGAAAGSGGSGSVQGLDKFSFFVTSYAAIQRLSGSKDGFGGDLRYKGAPDGLTGADAICTEIAEASMPGSSAKVWRAFLSVTKGPDGNPVHAIDRVGQGPWYDRVGRLVALNRTDILNGRPGGADAAIKDDLPNEDGVPNHDPDLTGQVDNHDILTGTNNMGQLYSADWSSTCHDWTSKVGADGKPRVGHSWPRSGFGGFPFPGGGAIDTVNWMSSLDEAGCAPGAFLVEAGPPGANGTQSVGDGGGYGGIYCLALSP